MKDHNDINCWARPAVGVPSCTGIHIYISPFHLANQYQQPSIDALASIRSCDLLFRQRFARSRAVVLGTLARKKAKNMNTRRRHACMGTLVR